MMTKFSNFSLSALLCLVLLLNHSATGLAANTTATSILVLGDSLSGAYGINTDEGWVALLQRQIIKQGYKYNVINASVSGDTTRTGLSRINSALQSHQPAIVILALGGNDGLRGLPFSEIESSLSAIIDRCKKNNAKVLLAGVRLPPNYGPVYNQHLATLYRNLADRYNIPLVPQILAQVAEHRELLQEDGIHPTAKAQPQIMKNIWVALEPMLEKS